jgi:hypothetical protein
MRPYILIFFSLFYAHCAHGQGKLQRAEIMKPVETLFRAMELGDSSLLSEAFYSQARLATVSLTGDLQFKALTFENSTELFKKAIAGEKKEPYHEPVYDVKIQSEGIFAQVWARYAFYIGNNFHHCGIDTFQLIKTEGVWKIFYLADTRQVKGCKVAASIRKKFETR